MKELRYKETEIGLIPYDWEVKSLNEIAQIIGGGTPSTTVSAYWNGDINWFTPAEITKAPKYVKNSERRITSFGLKNSSAKLLPAGTILLTTRATIGATAILMTTACTNQGFQSLIVSSDYSNELVYYIIPLIKNKMLNNAGGSTFPEISPQKLSKINIAVPPTLTEQKRIASALCSVDNLIYSLDNLIQKKKKIKQGAMQQLLTGKKRLKGFTEPWEECQLGDALQFEQPTPYIVKETDYVDNGVPVLTAGKSFILGYTTEEVGIYDKGDVIIFDDFTTDSKYVTFPFKAKSSAMKMLTANEGFVLRFMYELLSTIDYKPSDHMRHWIGMFSKLTIKTPPLNEQLAIANISSSMDNEISALEAKKAKYESIKQGMMQVLLTGKIRLT